VIPPRLLRDWHHDPCRYLTDSHGRIRKVTMILVKPPVRRNHPKVRVFLVTDLDTITEMMEREQPEMVEGPRGKRRRLPTPVYTDTLGNWLTDPQAYECYGVGTNFLWFWSKEKKSIHRKAQMALRSKPIPNSFTGPGCAEVTGYLDADIESILKGEVCKNPGTGTGREANRLRDEQRAKAKMAFDSILAGGRKLPPSEVFAKAKKKFGVGKSFMRRAFELYGKRVKGTFGQTYLWTKRELPSNDISLLNAPAAARSSGVGGAPTTPGSTTASTPAPQPTEAATASRQQGPTTERAHPARETHLKWKKKFEGGGNELRRDTPKARR
jgi:hypothetical protein